MRPGVTDRHGLDAEVTRAREHDLTGFGIGQRGCTLIRDVSDDENEPPIAIGAELDQVSREPARRRDRSPNALATR